MTPQELKFAYQVRNALNESTDNLPLSTAEKLAAARKAALSRKKQDAPLRAVLPQRVPATAGAGWSAGQWSWLGRMSMAVPLLALVAGLVGIYQFEQQRRISETAEIDAGVLSDELPLSAYLDHGFNAYLATRGE